MAAVSYEQLSERQQEVLQTTRHDREGTIEALSFLAFYSHVRELGRQKNNTPRLHQGDTTISIPAFFALPGHKHNALGDRALEILPTFSYAAGYADSTDTRINESELRSLINLRGNKIEAAAQGRALDFIMAEALGLDSEQVREVFSAVDNRGRVHAHGGGNQRVRRLVSEGQDLARAVNRTRDERINGPVSEVAGYTRSIAVGDMFDYLRYVRFDTRQDITQIIGDAVAARSAEPVAVAE